MNINEAIRIAERDHELFKAILEVVEPTQRGATPPSPRLNDFWSGVLHAKYDESAKMLAILYDIKSK